MYIGELDHRAREVDGRLWYHRSYMIILYSKKNNNQLEGMITWQENEMVQEIAQKQGVVLTC